MTQVYNKNKSEKGHDWYENGNGAGVDLKMKQWGQILDDAAN